MITREQKSRLQAFLIITFILMIVVLAIFIGPKLKEKGDTYFTNFKGMSVNGVNEGSDVKYQGVSIGKVSRIDVNTDDLSSILIYVEIKKGFPVKKDMRAKLQYLGITGLRFVEIYGGTTVSETLEPGSEILMGKGLGEKAEDIVINVDSLVDAINNILKPENREKISLTLTNIEKSTGVIARVLEKKEKNLRNFIENIDRSSLELSKFSENLNKFSQQLNDLAEKMRLEGVVENTNRMVRHISDRFSQQELGQVLKDLDNFLTTSASSMKKIEANFLDLKAKLNKTLVSLRESMENLSKFTRDLTEDPTILIRKRTEKRSKK